MPDPLGMDSTKSLAKDDSKGSDRTLMPIPYLPSVFANALLSLAFVLWHATIPTPVLYTGGANGPREGASSVTLGSYFRSLATEANIFRSFV
ncbi:hypothetical protein AAP_03894 [Ascosphaera apis ARSEF 7405]|uniref:Uncharacterized protein n=1 Tax=Ascosphaera apis ARSEF 7405 TaxID=392613 RepID=A0A167XQZ8_9EURO|nr:hypothetical protein AAP_03894 [Ascosphaera apis ARSEF 7405]